MINFKNTISNFTNANRGTRFAGTQICEDYYWGTYHNGTPNQIKPRKDGCSFSANSLTNKGVIIIVAESPHTQEFSFSKNAHQNHCTGFRSPLHRCDHRISKYLSKNSNNWFSTTSTYDIVLVNAIQYQCSFGLPLWNYPTNQKQRDNVFIWTWDNEPAKNDLLDRIDIITAKKGEVIILNCCTKKLKKYCNSSLFLNTHNVPYFRVFDERHPSTW